MRPFPLPHRVSFLASDITLPPHDETLTFVAAMVVNALLHEAMNRHPLVSVGDYADENLSDGAGGLLDAHHPGFGDTVVWSLGAARRDEVLWFQLGLLDPRRPAGVVLHARGHARGNADGHGGKEEDWSAFGGNLLSQQMMACLGQWLEARRLPPVPRPLPPFSSADLVALVEQLDRALTAVKARQDPAPHLAPPPALAVAFHRVMQQLASSGLDAAEMDRAILALEPDNVVSRRNRFLATLDDPGASRAAILEIVGDAPMWGKPHLSVHGVELAALDDRLPLRHQGIAAQLLPTNPWALSNLALQLREANRHEEAYRALARACVHAPDFARAHLEAARGLRACGRTGQAYVDGRDHCEHVFALWQSGRLPRSEWALKVQAGIVLAELHADVGRLEEAVRIADQTFAGLSGAGSGHESFRGAMDRAERWRRDPETLATGYAREGWFRGEPGRVLAGFARGQPRTGDEVEMVVESLIRVGKEELAPCAFWHLRGSLGAGAGGRARLAGAKALLLAGEVDAALDEIQSHQLIQPQSRAEAEINRLFRLGVAAPVAAWDAAIRRRLDLGARHLARLAARDACDFIPGMDQSAAAHEALGWGPERRFDAAVLAPLARALETGAGAAEAIARIDERLAHAGEGTRLEDADRLAHSWLDALPRGAAAEPTPRHAGALVYALGQALARYMALSHQPPTPLAGAWRQVATDALHLVWRARAVVETAWIRGLLEVLDVAHDADDWLFDAWVLRVERALDIEHRAGAHLEPLTHGLARVARFLRGDERIGFEQRMALDLRDDHAAAPQTCDLLERCLRAFGTGGAAAALSASAAAGRHPADALDAHWLGARANPAAAGEPWVALARALFASDQPDAAFDALVEGLAGKPERWRNEQVAQIRPLWERAGVPVPIDAGRAHLEGQRLLAAGDAEAAARCFRWSLAFDPKNTVLLEQLGTAAARLGHVSETVRAFSRADRRQGPKRAAHALLESHEYAGATLAYRYAAPGFTTAEEWKLLGTAARYREDHETAAEAYEAMDALLGGATDMEGLNAWATALYHAGLHEKCLPVAQRLLAAAGRDDTYQSFAHHALARALLGAGRGVEAVSHARTAVHMNSMVDHEREFSDTLHRAQHNEPYPATPLRNQTPERQAFRALEEGALPRSLSLSHRGDSWELARVALATAEFRHPTDNDRPVSPLALEIAQQILDRSAGQTDKHASLARVHALRIRENAYLQIDAPPPLGARLPRERFAALFRGRAGSASPTQPQPSVDESDVPEPPPPAMPPPRTPLASAPTAPVTDDPVVFPGTKVARLSDYVRIMKGLQSGDTDGVLSRAGLDMAAYAQIATGWGQRMAADPVLAAKFQKLMTTS
jgi:tetratricopeptide (TPR) repeat protein